jgi:ribonuclease HIII
MEKKCTSHVAAATPEQIVALETLLRERGWTFDAVPYAHWKAVGDKVNVVAYLSGKLTVQGGNTAEFVEFTLEPEILKCFSFGLGVADDAPELDRTPHGGIDESGKGDFFGPLVIAGVYTDADSARELAKIGVCDSKLIKSSAKIRMLAGAIRQATGGRFTVVAVGPESYNRMYAKIGNLIGCSPGDTPG